MIDFTRIKGGLYARALLMAGGSTARGVGILSLLHRVLSLSLSFSSCLSFSRTHTHTYILDRVLLYFSLSFSSSLTNIGIPRHQAVLVCHGQYFHPCSILLSRFARFDVSVISLFSLSSLTHLILALCLPVYSLSLLLLLHPFPPSFPSRIYTRAHTRSLSPSKSDRHSQGWPR